MQSTTFSPGVVDVFCGVGGLTHGFYKEGFKILGGIDVDPSCKYAFEENNDAPFIEKSVEDLWALNGSMCGKFPIQYRGPYQRESGGKSAKIVPKIPKQAPGQIRTRNAPECASPVPISVSSLPNQRLPVIP